MIESHCRLCAKLKPTNEINDNDEVWKNLKKCLLKYFKLDVDARDDLTRAVCLACSNKVNEVQLLDNQIKRAQVVLERLQANVSSNTKPIDTYSKSEPITTERLESYDFESKGASSKSTPADIVHIHDPDQKSLFWRKNVPGRATNRVPTTHPTKPSDFTQFQASVSDAWEVDDVKNISLNATNPSHADKKVTRAVYPGRPRALHTSLLPVSETDLENKLEKFERLLANPSADLSRVCELSWSGIPTRVRAITWKILAEYVPLNVERRASTLERKRADYWALVKQYYDVEQNDAYRETYRQIHIDIPRTNPLIPLFQQKLVQESFERVLFIWAIRHPASGYVQGINDLVTPFYIVFLQAVLFERGVTDLDACDVATLTADERACIEADAFWCLTKFLEGIQDNYIFAQSGIQRKVNRLKEIVQRVDARLHEHLVRNDVDYLQFSFRWFNNLLTRELPLHCTIRLWDTHLAEGNEFATFQLYVCAAFLLYWREQLLLEPDFQGLLLYLQNLPTSNWTSTHISLLVADAYRLKFMFADAPNHFGNNGDAR